MTPLQIDILLHYRCRGVDYREGDFSAPAVRDAIDEFLEFSGMLQESMDDGDKKYELSDRGEFYVSALCDMPLPVWAMPD